MSFVDQKRGPSPTGIASAIVVQAAIGAAVIAGLSVTQFVQENGEKEMEPIEYKLPPPPEPEPIPEPQTRQQPEVASQPPITQPNPPIDFELPKASYETTDKIFDRPITFDPPRVIQESPAPPAPIPSFNPVTAKPRNDPGTWLSDRDYKSAWARRELTGVASFRLDIAATGRVTGCRITGSTGHSELDQATCALIQRRARFEPARGSNGEPVAGSFSSSVRWQLPD